MRRLTHILPVLGFLALDVLLLLANYTGGTFLMGWDNLMPEFNFWQNLQRNIFGVWLQYRGLGLLDGQSHAAALPHTILIGILGIVEPQSLIRYTFTFGMHALGMIGMFYLVKYFLGQSRSKNVTATITALFYGFNPATIQMFYTPFEPFSIHFAVLPWLAYTLGQYFDKKPHAHIWLTLTLLFSTPQFFVPTLFLPVCILVASFAILHIKTAPKQAVLLGVGFLLINAFWLLPYLYGLHTNAPVIAGAKINQMSTNEIYLQNSTYGDAKDVLLLRGFPLSFQDFNQAGSPIFLMGSWKTYLSLPLVQFASWLFGLLAIAGLALSFQSKRSRTGPFIICGILTFILLATNTPIASSINAAIRSMIPFVSEGLRVPFTKFVLLFTLAYCVYMSICIDEIWNRLHKWSRVQQAVILAITAFFCILAFPVFTGDFISPLMRVSLPEDYQKAFAYFQNQPADARVAILPQPAYWSWKLYQFGYHGSGFFWFGLPQATLDRAFDPWSQANEQYYWELSYALFSKNILLLQNVMQKYNISYIVLDENLQSFNNDRALFIPETKALLSQMEDIQEVEKSGKIAIYRFTASQNGLIGLKENLPVISPAYGWTDNDVVYGQLGDYVAEPMCQASGVTCQEFPFRSLFTKRAVNEHEFTVTETSTTINIGSTLVATSAGIIKASAMAYDSQTTADLASTNVKKCGLLTEGRAGASNVLESAVVALRFDSRSQRGCLSFDVPTLVHKSGYLVAVESVHVSGRPLMISFINDTAKHTEEESYLPEATTSQTSYFILPPLASDGLGYNLYIANDSIGTDETINELSRIRIYQIPYQAMVTIHASNNLFNQNNNIAIQRYNNIISVSHPNSAFYKITLAPVPNRLNPTLILSQSYDSGWILLAKTSQFPYLKPIGTHILVDNWENGWTINSGQNNTFYIIFWPQILEFLGFALLPLPFVFAKKLAS